MRFETMALVGFGWAALATGCGDSGGVPTPFQPSPGPVANTTTTTSAPAPPPSPPTTTTSVPSGPRTLRRATFVNANGYVTEGTARIQMEDGVYSLELDSDFRTSNSAALDVRLCTNANCTGDHLSLGALQRFGGRQSYPLDNAANAYGFVTIYCLAVRLPFGYGRLQ